MTRSQRILATCALTVGVLGGMAGPALADNSMPISPQDHHADIAPPDNGLPRFAPSENPFP
ncbi:hypothetical protein OIE63_25985 [Streptomyces sp. NBC_01795]|uniref:hypothetical protein n=1 Tax=unclassified Streptomyces TaxID=2593676 RepID=UPI002DDC4750|nr:MULTISPECIES: hypothetical protein [unclassified Streptomyces]WSA94632.1 hypothetical protein OIE63_25985 [Streptomyces sp. NBC_01795]WSB79052.1 hypothetical protein OHB04_27105 [Streptomyces sp. NBC_01775]WSS12748.1 hypothetical protein OG533_13125 [Streptomyces sp. NBC_01186]